MNIKTLMLPEVAFFTVTKVQSNEVGAFWEKNKLKKLINKITLAIILFDGQVACDAC